MDIYYVVSSIIVLLSLIMSIVMFINTLKSRKEVDVKRQEIKELNLKVRLLSRQLLIQNTTVQTYKDTVESLRKENVALKNRMINGKKKIDAINNFIADIKKT